MELTERLLKKDRRAVARLITMAENRELQVTEIIRELYEKTGNSHVIGITGPPGAGKSTLTDKLVKEARKEGKTAGIIAVDPTSPFTGGAILGDRIRMNDLTTDPGVFIRSMAARGHLGGLAQAVGTAKKILEIYGFDYIFLETVGVGQSEIEIARNADTTLMVMVPGLGDDIQALKAGVMEIGDIFVINKSDRDGADRTKMEIEMMLDFSHSQGRRPAVRQVIATEGTNIGELWKDAKEHFSYLSDTGLLQKRRVENFKLEIVDLAYQSILNKVLDSGAEERIIDRLAEEVAQKRMDPYSAAEQILAGFEG